MARTAFSLTLNGVLCAAGVAVMVTACRKPDEDLGLELLPGDPLGAVLDTAELRAYTFLDSGVQTSGLTRNLVGAYVDPSFGLLRTTLVTQVRLTSNNIGQGQDTSTLVADSLVLSLVFETPNTHYGNLNEQSFSVHELTEGLSVDSLYRSDDLPQLGTDELVYPHRDRVTPDPYTAPTIAGDTLPQVRLRLTDALANRILDAFGTADLADNAAFLSFFKGLSISVADPSQAPYQGGILHINTSNSTSKLTLYYHDLEEPAVPLDLDMVINSSCVRYTAVERDRTLASDPGLEMALEDTFPPAPAVYLQPLGGYRTAIRFPDVQGFRERGRALSKAELVVPVLGAYYPYHAPPSLLFLFRKGTEGDDVFLPDQQNGITGIGGSFVQDEQAYRFNITRYIQQVMNGDLPDNGIVLVAGGAGVSANRAVLAGPEAQGNPMRLLLTFTTY